MADYVLLYSGGKMPETKEEQDAVMAAWNAWFGELGWTLKDGGNPFTPGQQISVPTGPLIEIVEVQHPDAHMDWAVAFGGPELRALQLVWADDRGCWPWAVGFGDGRRRQPVLGLRAASE